jgi:uroporphyrinogen-III synthase
MAVHKQVVVITRPIDQAEDLRRAVLDAGGHPLLFPTIRIVKVGHAPPAGHFDALLLTSQNAALYASVSVPCPTVAVGTTTAAAAAGRGWPCELAPQGDADGIVMWVEARFGTDLAGRRFLFPHSDQARPLIPRALAARGAEVVDPIVYRTQALTEGPRFMNVEAIHWVTFASPSAIDGFLARAMLHAETHIACIGATTALAAEDRGLQADVVSPRPSPRALVAAMAAYGNRT